MFTPLKSLLTFLQKMSSACIYNFRKICLRFVPTTCNNELINSCLLLDVTDTSQHIWVRSTFSDTLHSPFVRETLAYSVSEMFIGRCWVQGRSVGVRIGYRASQLFQPSFRPRQLPYGS